MKKEKLKLRNILHCLILWMFSILPELRLISNKLYVSEVFIHIYLANFPNMNFVEQVHGINMGSMDPKLRAIALKCLSTNNIIQSWGKKKWNFDYSTVLNKSNNHFLSVVVKKVEVIRICGVISHKEKFWEKRNYV